MNISPPSFPSSFRAVFRAGFPPRFSAFPQIPPRFSGTHLAQYNHFITPLRPLLAVLYQFVKLVTKLVQNPRWPPNQTKFENSKTIDWSVMSIRFYRHLKIQNPSIISRFIPVCKIDQNWPKIQDGRQTKPNLKILKR